jgi:hypothetical protein
MPAPVQRRGADLFERQHAEHFAKTFHLTVKQRQQRFRRLVRMLSFEEIGTSTLQSRAVAGVANHTLIFAMPGSE